ncbi:ATP-binding cassette domain-containing protein [Corynebacterium pygosceleis]|uniref:ATP-binding cassette domain-containing protein n=1 Tax=Corynebacterium pygosceleis TaxID=2800406 RepID=UPI003CFEB3AD
MTALTPRDLGVTHGARRLFEHLDLSVTDGRRWGLTGPNGTGKSTLLSVCAGKGTGTEITEGTAALGTRSHRRTPRTGGGTPGRVSRSSPPGGTGVTDVLRRRRRSRRSSPLGTTPPATPTASRSRHGSISGEATSMNDMDGSSRVSDRTSSPTCP